MRTILTIDGGGIRGLIPATVLMRLEEYLGLCLSDCFDVIAGVSTGGILATGLAAPRFKNGAKLRASDMCRFYTEDGPGIFRRRWPRTLELFRPRYKADILSDIMKVRMPGKLLSDTDCELLVTTYARNYSSAIQFCTRRAKNDPRYNFLLSDIATASSLAPTYFGSRAIVSIDGSRRIECIDGGVARNNVTTLAIAHSKRLWPGEPVFVLSLGTGSPTSSPAGAGDARNWGALKWAPRVIATFMDASTDFVTDEMRAFADEWYRVNPSIDNGMVALDNCSDENLRNLVQQGELAWKHNLGAMQGKVASALAKRYAERQQEAAKQ